MKPQERLAEIKHEDHMSGGDRDIGWLIARVEQLEEALGEISEIQYPSVKHSWDGLKHQQLAVKALNTCPKVSSSLSEKPDGK